ncbi:unnamed protein product [Taenia asiatica]|uniref:Uncharacterized protein n=1 Tax=Taenia asiatica TaxID=60517 RepID=A0A0R3WGJ8_TAEAS|nr:unnamed protein product [Taenia asiatica]
MAKKDAYNSQPHVAWGRGNPISKACFLVHEEPQNISGNAVVLKKDTQSSLGSAGEAWNTKHFRDVRSMRSELASQAASVLNSLFVPTFATERVVPCERKRQLRTAYHEEVSSGSD